METKQLFAVCVLIALVGRSVAQAPDDPDVTFSEESSPLGTAISSFFGYYLFSVRFYPEYCKSLGVDIAPFVNTYKAINREAYVDATIALRTETEGKVDEEMFYRDLAQSVIPRHSWDVAAEKSHVTPVKLCQNYVDNPQFFTANRDFAKQFPDRMSLLQGAQKSQ